MLLDFKEIKSHLSGIVELPISKSLCNRALILRAISNQNIYLSEISKANDSVILERCLNTTSNVIDVEDAGTAMRFLTAYFAFQQRSIELRGSKRMHQRPIGSLVEALNAIGANVTYIENDGFPPIRLDACKLEALTTEVSISANTSSQFISALMLIAPSLPVGLTIHLEGKTASRPYIEMTHSLLQHAGVTSVFKGNKIVIQHHEFQPQTIDLESDWSAASYFYGIAAMRRNSKIQLTNLNSDSFQGDSIIVKWFQEYFGVSSQFNQEGVQLNSTNDFKFPTELELDFTPYPDLAQTLVVLCACLGIRLKATGLESLLIKETNRLLALSTELEKIGVHSAITSNSIAIEGQIQLSDTPAGISTYQDHRMAMAFSMVSLLRPIRFDNEKVVSKSFPSFFSELAELFVP